MTAPNVERDTVAAFRWIVSLLRRRGYPFAVVGGLAANVYGASRPLCDIDIDVPRRVFTDCRDEFAQFVTFGPAAFRDAEFDIELLSLRFAGQDIDLTAAETIRLYDKSRAAWVALPTDLSATEEHRILGLSVPVMRQDLLVAYKALIARETDLCDIAEMAQGVRSSNR
jgi:hypothetical protein